MWGYRSFYEMIMFIFEYTRQRAWYHLRWPKVTAVNRRWNSLKTKGKILSSFNLINFVHSASIDYWMFAYGIMYGMLLFIVDYCCLWYDHVVLWEPLTRWFYFELPSCLHCDQASYSPFQSRQSMPLFRGQHNTDLLSSQSAPSIGPCPAN
jgi:hypothetical protein